MKRRVQAQRKFAAGIQIPNSCKPQQNNGDRRNEIQPESRVFQIHTTPSSILDVVSFQGIHSHLQPVVLLKRLKDNQTNNQEVEVDSPPELRSRPKRHEPSRLQPVPPKKPKVYQNCTKKKSQEKCHSLIDKEVFVLITPLPDPSHRIKDDTTENSNLLPQKQGASDNSSLKIKCTTGWQPSCEPGEQTDNTTDDITENSNLLPLKREEEISTLEMRCANGWQPVYEPLEQTDDTIADIETFKEERCKLSSRMSMISETLTENPPAQENSDPVMNCPSRLITTVKEVMLYSNNVLLKRCGSCKFCTKIEMTLQAVATLKSAGLLLPNDMNFENILTYVDLTKESGEDGPNTEESDENFPTPEAVLNNDLSNINIRINTPEAQRSSGCEATEAHSSNNRAETPASMSSDDEVLSKKKTQKSYQKTKMQDAPVFRPTREEFKDPMRYLESILPEAAKFGLCKVIPPEGFDPPCVIDGDIRFGTTSQYIARMYSRWGPAARELCTIRAHLATQKVQFKRPPLLDGREVNLPKLFLVVQRLGGLKNVFTKKKWNKVAEELRYTNLINPGKRLDQVYVKYLLPYEALTNQERKKLILKINSLWKLRYNCMLARALNPLHRQKQIFNESESSDEEEIDCRDYPIFEALSEMEDCVITGRAMTLKMFRKIAESSLDAVLQSSGSSTQHIEKEYWKLVVKGMDHVCVYAASIDTGVANLGFPDNTKAYSKHPWNLKRLSENRRNILSFLGPVVGMTVPTLHLSMVFTTSCWHRDPHGLPWIEYMHEGAEKVWYGIPDSQSDNFRNAVEKLCPTFCQNKLIWLPSDITMIPPELLQDYNISMCRATQKPGEFIIVCPKAYSCSIATNYTVSESVYFATESWLHNIQSVSRELRESCEPTMFSFEQLLISFTKDPNTPLGMIKTIYPVLKDMVNSELNNRKALSKLGYNMKITPKKEQTGAWNVRDQEECSICRMTLYLSLVRGVVDKKSILCLEDALTIVRRNRKTNEEKKSITLEVIYLSEELIEILKDVEHRLKGVAS